MNWERLRASCDSRSQRTLSALCFVPSVYVEPQRVHEGILSSQSPKDSSTTSVQLDVSGLRDLVKAICVSVSATNSHCTAVKGRTLASASSSLGRSS